MNTRRIPDGWHIVKIKDIFDRVRNPVEVDLKREYKQIGIRSHGKGIFYKEPVTGEQLGNKSVFWVEPDCFIVNIVFAWEMAVARTTNKDKGYIASHRFPMYRPKQGILDLGFITYLFKSPRGKYLLNLASPGGAGRNKTLGQKEFEETEILIPQNIEEQKKIALILSTWDKAIELKQKLIEQKKEQKTGLIETLLSGKKRIKGFKGEWKHVKLKEIAHINKESLNSNTSSDYEFYYYDISSVENGNVAIQKDLIKFLDAPSRARRVFRKNDILMSTVRPNLKGFAFIDFEVNDAICSTGFAVITAEEVATNKFIYYNLFSTGIETQIEKLIVGSNYPAINASEVGNLKIYYPFDPKERQQIVDIIYCADKELKLLQLELMFLKEQKNALMQQLLTGKIRVKV